MNMSTSSSNGTSLNKIEIESSNKKGDLPVYISTNKGNGKAAIVVVQEWWGITQQIQRQAVDWFTSEANGNFTVAVPDLYRGVKTDDMEKAQHLMNDLDFEGAVKDIKAAVHYLKNEKGFEKVGVVGFCMGGALALASAVHIKEVDAANVFYGIPDPSFAPVGSINIPLQLHFGNEDDMKGFSDPESVNHLEEALKDGSVDYTLYRYDSVGHAFTNDRNQGQADFKKATQTAHKRAIEFFNKHLLGQ